MTESMTVSKEVERWLLEFSSKHHHTQVLKFLCERDGGFSINSPKFPKIWYTLCVLHEIIESVDRENFPLAIGLLGFLHDHTGGRMRFRYFALLDAGLKMMAMYYLLENNSKTIEATLNKYFPKGRNHHFEADRSLQEKLNTNCQKFRQTVLTLLADKPKKERFLKRNYPKEFGPDFVERLKKYLAKCTDKIAKAMPPTILEQIVTAGADSDFAVGLYEVNDPFLSRLLDCVFSTRTIPTERQVLELVKTHNVHPNSEEILTNSSHSDSLDALLQKPSSSESLEDKPRGHKVRRKDRISSSSPSAAKKTTSAFRDINKTFDSVEFSDLTDSDNVSHTDAGPRTRLRKRPSNVVTVEQDLSPVSKRRNREGSVLSEASKSSSRKKSPYKVKTRMATNESSKAAKKNSVSHDSETSELQLASFPRSPSIGSKMFKVGKVYRMKSNPGSPARPKVPPASASCQNDLKAQPSILVSNTQTPLKDQTSHLYETTVVTSVVGDTFLSEESHLGDRAAVSKDLANSRNAPNEANDGIRGNDRVDSDPFSRDEKQDFAIQCTLEPPAIKAFPAPVSSPSDEEAAKDIQQQDFAIQCTLEPSAIRPEEPVVVSSSSEAVGTDTEPVTLNKSVTGDQKPSSSEDNSSNSVSLLHRPNCELKTTASSSRPDTSINRQQTDDSQKELDLDLDLLPSQSTQSQGTYYLNFDCGATDSLLVHSQEDNGNSYPLDSNQVSSSTESHTTTQRSVEEQSVRALEKDSHNSEEIGHKRCADPENDMPLDDISELSPPRKRNRRILLQTPPSPGENSCYLSYVSQEVSQKDDAMSDDLGAMYHTPSQDVCLPKERAEADADADDKLSTQSSDAPADSGNQFIVISNSESESDSQWDSNLLPSSYSFDKYDAICGDVSTIVKKSLPKIHRLLKEDSDTH